VVKNLQKSLEFIFLKLTIIVISLIFTRSGTFETENGGRKRSILQLFMKLPTGFRPQDVDRPPRVVHRRRADQDDLQRPAGVDRSSRISLVATPSRPGTQSYKTILSSLKDLASSSIIFSLMYSDEGRSLTSLILHHGPMLSNFFGTF
jgi:hypothetical protein